MKKVSIIVPVYNSSLYLSACIESLINQSYIDIEIILIDDGATDGSDFICDHYSKKDNRIIVIHQDNSGICAARNRGIDVSSGDYIMFCDDDDIYTSTAVENAVKLIDDVDLVKFPVNYITIFKDKIIREDVYGITNSLLIKDVSNISISEYKKIRERKSLVYIWNAIYKKDIIEKYRIRFDERYKYGGEDFDFNLLYLMHVNKVLFSSEIIYSHYRRIGYSTSSKFNINQIYSVYANLKIEMLMINRFSDEKISLYVLMRQFWGLMSVMENKACDYGIKKIISEYKKFYYRTKRKYNLFNYHLKDLYESQCNYKQIIIMLMLKYHFFICISIISRIYQIIKKES